MNTQAVVLPVFNSTKAPYLTTLVHRMDTFTTMIWGWQGESKRMARPQEILHTQQDVLPFLFTETDQIEKAVTHAGICGLIVHRDDEPPANLQTWLVEHRVERFAIADNDHGFDSASFYVVTATTKLSQQIGQGQLTIVSENRPLDPGKQRGYSVVWLPDSLATWYSIARERWQEGIQRLSGAQQTILQSALARSRG